MSFNDKIIARHLAARLAQTIPSFQNIGINFKTNSNMVHCQKLPPYSNISKKCLLYLHEKLKIINGLRPDKLLNRRSKLTSQCCHASKFLLPNYKTNH